MAKKISPAPPKSSKPAGDSRRAKATFRVKNELGLHARAAALFVKVASRFKSEISVSRGPNSVNGKSIMGILMLAAAVDSEIRIAARGEDAALAVRELGKLVDSKFGEK